MCTVNTRNILPCPTLRPFVRYLAIRDIDTHGEVFSLPKTADHEMTMVFFYQSKLYGFESLARSSLTFTNSDKSSGGYFTGIQTYTNAIVKFKGMVSVIVVHFKPAGLYHIFNLSPKELVDQMGECQELLSNETCLLQEQIHEMRCIEDGIDLVQRYLLKKLNRQRVKYRHAGIVPASELLMQSNGLYPIGELASHCNMTIQTFEVQFVEQVGISPKYFSRIMRFMAAVNRKLYRPSDNWTHVAHTVGFYDQVHLIKDFKEFTGMSPKNFFKQMPLPVENFE